MAEWWKHAVALWPTVKDAVETGVSYLGLPGFLFAGFWLREWFERRAIQKRFDALNDKNIETGEKSTAVLLAAGKKEIDLMRQIKALNAKIEKPSAKGRNT